MLLVLSIQLHDARTSDLILRYKIAFQRVTCPEISSVQTDTWLLAQCSSDQKTTGHGRFLVGVSELARAQTEHLVDASNNIRGAGFRICHICFNSWMKCVKCNLQFSRIASGVEVQVITEK